ncbi:hypothetical protein MLD38_024993 [Melastoma candidum]|uniref:Uncharacterized protein n=1 Tax=Melastoma candidum TaxID=119954 RepID=A0ACB9NUY9_9MYRT|nr:hypothetical protein MLD38_024993 [Melastoma candidum]
MHVHYPYARHHSAPPALAVSLKETVKKTTPGAEAHKGSSPTVVTIPEESPVKVLQIPHSSPQKKATQSSPRESLSSLLSQTTSTLQGSSLSHDSSGSSLADVSVKLSSEQAQSLIGDTPSIPQPPPPPPPPPWKHGQSSESPEPLISAHLNRKYCCQPMVQGQMK